ncbi:MAG TPA: hypothetical protein VHM24_13410 [Gemmatimonadaceae bacterium]|nr:hypothetical protein [Gemmatimonadaceae bacterium]
MTLGLVLVGIVGLITELLLLDHTDSFNQLIPLLALGAGLAVTIAVWLRPGSTTLRLFKMTMISFVVIGLLGVYLHYSGNVEWARERDPDIAGLALAWRALKGATPALAPGALAQTGLLGLIFGWSYTGSHRSSA